MLLLPLALTLGTRCLPTVYYYYYHYIVDDDDEDGYGGEYITHANLFLSSSTYLGGYAYCAVAALTLLDSADPGPHATPTRYIDTGIPSIPALIHFLVNRQFAYTDSENDDSDGNDTPDHPPDLSSLSLSDSVPPMTGFNGRLNKLPDTCYTWWNSGTLSLLGQDSLISRGPARRFLLEKTQHQIGGFAKHPGGPPDVYHAYMGLAALATIAGTEGEPGLRTFDSRLCISADAAARMAKARESILHPTETTGETDSEEDD
ncbi:hypothetical protein ONZ43_g7579 [Nemania bipapillata]|uniref:Uncharacterized protein n=1 Tax=Nemania bipapillata TaxID=110536 RepID=A0ACC2HQ58_9PEZI|nr:hypothetical protein ONZ43_g7579 [Nemania bipapillata]